MDKEYLLDNLRLELEKSIKNIANFLFLNQVTYQDKIILNTVEAKDKSLDALPFNNNVAVNWKFKYFENSWHFQDNDGNWQEMLASSLIRLPVYGHTYQEQAHKFKDRINLKSKIKHYSHYNDFFVRVISYLYYKFFNLLIGKVKNSHTCFNKDLSKQGGLTFFVNVVNQDIYELQCVDIGGIYDKFLDDETTNWPDQVPVGHYSTEFAVYIFYWMWKNTDDKKWLKVCQEALNFCIKNTEPYTSISFNSYEFKVLPIAYLTNKIVENGDESFFPLEKVKKILTDTWYDYDPVNIHALRMANFALLESIGVNYSKLKFQFSSRVVLQNQTEEGLIKDNRGGSLRHSADLTYHQFSLGCLALAYRFYPTHKLKGIIERAVGFSRYIALPDGHVSYYGRGANNVYHLAAYAFAESQLQFPNYDYIIKIIEKINYFADPEKGLPSALNDQREKRMGWNHCAVPYNGQVGFFLCLTHESFYTDKDFSRSLSSIKVLDSDKNLDFAAINNDNFKIIITRGSDTHEWSGGAHIVGMGGICSLVINDQNYLAVNEFSAIDNIWSGDIPFHDNNPMVGNDFVGQLKKVNDQLVHLFLNNFKIVYQLDGNILKANYFFGDTASKYKFFGGLSFRKLFIKDYIIKENKCQIIFINGDVVNLAVEDNKKFIITTRKIESNPYGEIVKFEWTPVTDSRDFKSLSWSLCYDRQ